MSDSPARRRGRILDDTSDELDGEDALPMSTPFQREVVIALRELGRGVTALKTGQGELTAAYGALVPRLAKLEGEAVWGRRLVVVLKHAATALVPIVVLKWPAIGAVLAELLKGAGP